MAFEDNFKENFSKAQTRPMADVHLLSKTRILLELFSISLMERCRRDPGSFVIKVKVWFVSEVSSEI